MTGEALPPPEAEADPNDYWNRQRKKESILSLAQSGDWEGVLEAYGADLDYREPLLVWIRPDRELMSFLDAELARLGVDTVLSVGCGCGFLEWIVSKATRLKVVVYIVLFIA